MSDDPTGDSVSPSAFVARRGSRSLGSGELGGVSVGLPPDLVRKAGRRLGIAALAYSSVYVVAYLAPRLGGSSPAWAGDRTLYPSDFAAAGFILLSLGMFAVARWGGIPGARLLDIGLVYEVIAAAGIDFNWVWGNWLAGMEYTGLSWVCVWIVFFPLIVPSTPGKTGLAALAAASMTPLMYLIGVSRGGPPLVASGVLLFVLPNYLCVAMAMIGSRVVYRLGADISRARRLGSYRLVEKLGEGGMGEVWRAEHRMLARPAAIKLVRSDAGDGGSGRTPGSHLHRFEREVQATAQLRSPHTVEVYDYGLTEDGTFYYVMELLDGLSLEEMVKHHGPLSAERAVHVLRQICHSLAEAHSRGLVHRDVKPANVFLCRYGLDHDFVKVLDFGLVKQAGRGDGGDVKLTDVGAFAGTPAYGSPEGALGDVDEIDGRSDLYSVGCVAYWLLTGHTVFSAATPIQMLLAHAHREPDPPSARTELEIPPELDALVLSCLSKSKTDRPASAEALVALLDAIPLARPWTPERAQEWWNRHRPRSGDSELSLRGMGDGRGTEMQPLRDEGR